MNSKQKNRLAAYNLVVNLQTEANPLILAMMPGAATRLANLKSAVGIIEDASGAQLHHSTPASGNKKEARASLEVNVFNGASAQRALAYSNKDLNLANEWELSESLLSRLTDQDLLDTANNLVTVNKRCETELEPYGITSRETEMLKQAAGLFHSLMPAPRENQLSETQATKALLYGLAWAEEEALHLDILVEMLRKREPAFHANYHNRRKVIKSASHPICLKGKVSDSNGNLMRYVTVTVDGLSLTARTTAKGNFRFPNLPDGVHVLRFALHGYQELRHTVAVNSGRSKPAAIELREL